MKPSAPVVELAVKGGTQEMRYKLIERNFNPIAQLTPACMHATHSGVGLVTATITWSTSVKFVTWSEPTERKPIRGDHYIKREREGRTTVQNVIFLWGMLLVDLERGVV